MYLFGRDVACLISLNVADLNNITKIQKGVFTGDCSTGHARFEFSQVYTNRHGRFLTADRCFSNCIELITKNHTHYVNLKCKKVNVTSRFFGAVQLSWIMISCI